MATRLELEVQGMTTGALYTSLIDRGLTQSEAATLVSSWIFEHFGRTRRVFNYAQSFPAAEPGCVSTFTRTFHHADWVDGESVVQAEQTTGEEGFNQRFHRIEADLDKLGAEVAKTFTCMAAMRQSLRNLLDEVRAEINRLNSDVHECCSRRPDIGIVREPPPSFVDLLDNNRFLGTTTLGDKLVSLWKTDRGLMMLPAVSTVVTDLLTDGRVKRAGSLARYIAENKLVREVFGDRPVPRRDFVDRFGDDRVREGLTVRELVDILPEQITFRNLDLMIQAVTEREAAALRTSAGTTQAIATAFGIEPTTQKVAEARLDQVKTIPPLARAAMLRRGIDTVGKMAGVNPAELVKLLSDEGVTGITLGDTSEWTATAQTFNLIR